MIKPTNRSLQLLGWVIFLLPTVRGWTSSLLWEDGRMGLKRSLPGAASGTLSMSPLHVDCDDTKPEEMTSNCFRGIRYQATALVMGLAMLWTTTVPVAQASMPTGQRYWTIMETASPEEKIMANQALLEYAVGTINTQFYDNTGGAAFVPREFYSQWKAFARLASSTTRSTETVPRNIPDIKLSSREGAVQGLQWLVGTLSDPFSKYLTRDELRRELALNQNGFLGIGAIVEPPSSMTGAYDRFRPRSPTESTPRALSQPLATSSQGFKQSKTKKTLTLTRVANLPVVTAVAPDSPAERAGLVVGDRIVAVGDKDFLGWTRPQVTKTLHTTYNAESYLGQASLTVAKPIYTLYSSDMEDAAFSQREMVIGYHPTRVSLSTKATEASRNIPATTVAGGDSIVHWELLTSSSGSIFDHVHSEDVSLDDYKVGYVRLTRFSKASTAGYVQAVKALDAAGAQSYIFDLRNNYGGIIQEAMLTASTLLRDPHSILCYTMNARGGFTPRDAEEFIVDHRYPGYLLSSEAQSVSMETIQRENPAMFKANEIAWDPPSSFASLHEQVQKRGIRRISYVESFTLDPQLRQQIDAQKKIVLLINEGTASAAELFAAALHDNGRTVALVGTKTFGKGLIQHTFPMPDGGGLRLTVAEYLTPSLKHVTNVGRARFDPTTGEFMGGGIRPDIVCESKQGIPGNIRADLCLGVALDALEEAESTEGGESGISRAPSQILGKLKQH